MEQSRRTEEIIRDLLAVVYTHARGMWRFRWMALGLSWLVCAFGWFSVYSMPNVYEASSRVYVDTDNVLTPLLKGIAISTDVMNEVNIVTRELISRPNLANVARDTDLDLNAETPQDFENLLTSLQNRISVTGSREQIFTISFQATGRDTALNVVQSLVNTLVERSLGADRSNATQAQSFLQEQIQEYEERLTIAEDRLARFKRDNVAFMPDQRGDYFSRLQAARSTLQKTQSQLQLANERKSELLRQIEGEEPVFGIMPSSGNAASEIDEFASSKIRELEAELQVLRLEYTDKHPRIGQILETIEALRQQSAQRAATMEYPATAVPDHNALDENPVYQNMRIQLSNIEVEIASLKVEAEQQDGEVATLGRLVDTIPQVEADLNRLNRDYEVVKATYEQLVKQLETANIGDDVSKSIDDVQFRIIDPPYVDSMPIGPNRPLFVTAILVFAIGAGAAVCFLLNQLSPVFIGKRSVTEVTGLPVLASISLLQSEQQLDTKKMRNRLLVVSFLMLLIVYFAATTFADQGSQIVRSVLARLP